MVPMITFDHEKNPLNYSNHDATLKCIPNLCIVQNIQKNTDLVGSWKCLQRIYINNKNKFVII